MADIAQDVSLGNPAGSPFDPSNQLTTCWIDFGSDQSTFYVSNAINATISSFSLGDDGMPALLEQVAAAGVSGFANGGTTGPEVFGTTDGFIDLDVTFDGKYLYQLEGLSGEISAYAINSDASLTLVQDLSGFLPAIDTQGIITFNRYIAGDVNADEVVNLLDVSGFVECITSDSFHPEADINGDGVVNLLDIPLFVDLLTQ